jgi:hypothetical protein
LETHPDWLAVEGVVGMELADSITKCADDGNIKRVWVSLIKPPDRPRRSGCVE